MYTILIIDDQQPNINMIMDHIDLYFGLDNDIRIAKTYRASKKFIKDCFDLIICDNKLPDGFGSEFIKDYRKTNKNTKIIFHSADEELATDMSGYNCISFKEIKGELLSFKETYKRQIIESECREVKIDTIFNEKLCDERHKTINDLIEKISGRLNWFLFTGVGTLITTTSILFVQLTK